MPVATPAPVATPVPAPALRRPVPVRARLGETPYEKLAESTPDGFAEYHTWRASK